MKENKKSSKMPLVVIILLLIAAIAGIVVKYASDASRKNALNYMSTAIEDREKIIKSFVENSEKTLLNYSNAAQITDLLADENNKTLIEKAQKYTEECAQGIKDLDGIYVSNTSTKVLAHSEPSVVGVITRNDPSTLNALLSALYETEDKVFFNGIILSPASGKQILSMYKGVLNDDGELIGFTGFNVGTEQIRENNSISIKGVSEASYTLINLNDMKYLISNDEELLYKEVTNEKIVSLCNELKDSTLRDKGNLEYSEGSAKYIAAYKHIPEYGWLLMLNGKVSG